MMWSSLIICLLSSFLWRVRGGLKFWGHKVPLNKVWFALFFGGAFCYLTSWSLNVWAIVSLATFVSYQAYGWGEVKSCALGVGKPDDSRSDCDLVDDIIDNIAWHGHKLKDYPILFGIIGTSLRMLIMTFTMGLAFRNIPFMLCGLGVGLIYYIIGLFARKILKKYDKTGWNIAEWVEGLYWAICLILVC